MIQPPSELLQAVYCCSIALAGALRGSSLRSWCVRRVAGAGRYWFMSIWAVGLRIFQRHYFCLRYDQLAVPLCSSHSNALKFIMTYQAHGTSGFVRDVIRSRFRFAKSGSAFSVKFTLSVLWEIDPEPSIACQFWCRYKSKCRVSDELCVATMIVMRTCRVVF